MKNWTEKITITGPTNFPENIAWTCAEIQRLGINIHEKMKGLKNEEEKVIHSYRKRDTKTTLEIKKDANGEFAKYIITYVTKTSTTSLRTIMLIFHML